MEPNYSNLNLAETVYSENDYKNMQIKVERSDGQAPRLLYVAKKGANLSKKEWVPIAMAMDEMSQEILRQEIKAHASGQRSPQDFLRRLALIQCNLTNHHLFLSKMGVEGAHQRILEDIKPIIFHETKLLKSTWDQTQVEYDRCFENLGFSVESGRKIDAAWVETSLPYYMGLINLLEPFIADSHKAHLFQFVNAAYLKQMANKEAFPKMIMGLLNSLAPDSLNLDQLKDFYQLKMRAICQAAEKDPQLSVRTPADWIKEVQTKSRALILGEIADQRELCTILAEVFRVFDEAKLQHIQLEKKCKTELIQRCQKEWGKSPAWPHILARLEKVAAPLHLELFWQAVMNDPTLKDLDKNKDPKGFYSAVYQVLQSKKKEWLEGMENRIRDKFQADYGRMNLLGMHNWVERNQKYACFEFNQSQWGSSYALGEGVCFAINFKWMLNLIKKPLTIIRSLADIEEENPQVKNFATQIEKSALFKKAKKQAEREEVNTQVQLVQDPSIKISAETRKLHAEYAIRLKLEREGVRVPTALLQKYHLAWNDLQLPPEDTIEKLIDHVVQKEQDRQMLSYSQGVIDISCYKRELVEGVQRHTSGHAMGMQIDALRTLFRFWDVNKGFYQYPNLAIMRQEFSDYVRFFYGDEFNEFIADQYVIAA